MATITVHDENRSLTDADEIRGFLKPFGIWYEKWDVAGRLKDDATNDDVLETYKPEIDRLCENGGYVTADVISVDSETPGLQDMLNKFNKEHTHSEDEVRFVVKGQGVFQVHPDDGPVFGVHVESGDLINVPKGTKHWFDLCDDKQIRCIRLFIDPTGWTPEYIDGSALHESYMPVCLGPDFIPPEGAGGIDPVVKV